MMLAVILLVRDLQDKSTSIVSGQSMQALKLADSLALPMAVLLPVAITKYFEVTVLLNYHNAVALGTFSVEPLMNIHEHIRTCK